jgi:hypothetical protein
LKLSAASSDIEMWQHPVTIWCEEGSQSVWQIGIGLVVAGSAMAGVLITTNRLAANAW